jgi:hypothetical protein
MTADKLLVVYLNKYRDWCLKGYCDADWAGQKDRHSISGYSFHLGQGAVTWSSKKQYIIALSSTEAEYIAQTHAAKEALWLRTFWAEMQNAEPTTMKLNCDNQGAIALSKDNKFHARTKHIDIRYHFIREAVEDSKLAVAYIPTEDNPADIFTKALPKAKFKQFVELLGLRVIRGSPNCGGNESPNCGGNKSLDCGGNKSGNQSASNLSSCSDYA